MDRVISEESSSVTPAKRWINQDGEGADPAEGAKRVRRDGGGIEMEVVKEEDGVGVVEDVEVAVFDTCGGRGQMGTAEDEGGAAETGEADGDAEVVSGGTDDGEEVEEGKEGGDNGDDNGGLERETSPVSSIASTKDEREGNGEQGKEAADVDEVSKTSGENDDREGDVQSISTGVDDNDDDADVKCTGVVDTKFQCKPCLRRDGRNSGREDDKKKGKDGSLQNKDDSEKKMFSISLAAKARLMQLHKDYHALLDDLKRQQAESKKIESKNDDLTYELAMEKQRQDGKQQSKKALETEIQHRLLVVHKRVLQDEKKKHKDEIDKLHDQQKKKHEDFNRQYQAKLVAENDKHEKALERKDRQWETRNKKLEEKLERANGRHTQIPELKETIKNRETTIKEKEKELREADARIEGKDDEIRDLQRDIETLQLVDTENAELKDQLRRCQRSYRELRFAFKKEQEAHMVFAKQEKADRARVIDDRRKIIESKENETFKLVEERHTNFLMKLANQGMSVRYGELQQELAREKARVRELEAELSSIGGSRDCPAGVGMGTTQ